MKLYLGVGLGLFLGFGTSISLLADDVLINSGSHGNNRSDTATSRLSRRLAPDDSLQGVEGQLKGLYAQRDAIIKGLHNLGYDICLQSRIGFSNNLIKHLSEKKVMGRRYSPEISVVWDCPPNAKCKPPTLEDKENRGLKIVLPLLNQPHIYKREFKKTQVVERLLNYDEKEKKNQFTKHFFQRTSCLMGDGIGRACRLLSSDKKVKDPSMKRLKELLDKNPEFKGRFDQELACKIADSKADYIEKLKPVQETIVEFENKLKKARKGISDDGGLTCTTNDQEIETCTIVEPQPDPVLIGDDGGDTSGGSGATSGTTTIDLKDLICERAGQRGVEFCTDGKTGRYRCTWDNGKRYCRRIETQ